MASKIQNNHSSPHPFEHRLRVIKQESFGVDNFHNNQNKHVDLHFIAKNVPFTVVIESALPISSQEAVRALLVYESDPNKPVEGIQKDSFAFIAHLLDQHHCSVELRINALSSQHEGANFLLQFAIGEHKVLSNPIKVLSKRTQIDKHLKKVQTRLTQSSEPQKRKPRRQTLDDEEEVLKTPSTSAPSGSAPAISSTAMPNNEIVAMLRILEAQQREQRQLLERLALNGSVPSSSSSASTKKMKAEEDANIKNEFENRPHTPVGPSVQSLIAKLVQTWNSLSSVDRSQAIETTIGSLTEDNTNAFKNFLHVASSSLGGSTLPLPERSSHKLENFFSEFLSGDDNESCTSPAQVQHESSPDHFWDTPSLGPVAEKFDQEENPQTPQTPQNRYVRQYFFSSYQPSPSAEGL